MNDSPEQVQTPTELEGAIADARSFAREQVFAAWQLHIDRVREQLETGWRESLDEIFDTRFNEVEIRLRENFEDAVAQRSSRQLEDAAAFARLVARRELTEQLNQTVRRLKQAESRDVWIHTLLEATSEFCGKSALFLVGPRGLLFGGARGVQVPADAPMAEVPLASAPAFANVIESKDTVVAIGTPRELSLTITALLGDASDRRVYLFPILQRQNPVAVLYAEADGTDEVNVSALELLISLGGGSREPSEPPSVSHSEAGGQLVSIANAAPPKAARPAWADLTKAEQEVHLRAQRFARTQAAQMLLHRVSQVRAGRAANDLYRTLRDEIDAGREAFRAQFLETCPSMVDYYHLELVRTLAKERVDALGPGYPGPLVG